MLRDIIKKTRVADVSERMALQQGENYNRKPKEDRGDFGQCQHALEANRVPMPRNTTEDGYERI